MSQASKSSNKPSISRRGFLRRAGASITVASLARRAQAARSAEATVARIGGGNKLQRILPNLYMLEDACNVYLVKDGGRGLLIDFGSGSILELLGEAGVSKIDWLLHTHHHRDQCQGDHRAVSERIPIAVPAHERHLFEDAENFWRNRRVFHLYYVRNDFYTVTKNIPVATVLRDYEVFSWGPYEFLVLPTPAHTLGSITLIATIDGKKVAFSGDLIHSPGKLINLYDLQYNYGSFDGIDFAIWSLTRLREQGAELLCPSHGAPMSDPDNAIDSLIAKLKEWYAFYPNTPPLTIDSKLEPISPHLVASPGTTSAFYAIISDSGKALFVDYGSASGNFFRSLLDATPANDRIRFIEHSIPELKARFGLKSIDIAMPSHMHDDHLNGFPHLQRKYGTQVWCYENMKDVLENPRNYNLGCILGEPIKVDRTLAHKETFKWEGFEFTVLHSPGHTEYQMAMIADIDGQRVAFTGDGYFKGEKVLRHNIIYRNHIESDSHLKSVLNIMEYEPTLIAPGHGSPFKVTKADFEEFRARMLKQRDHFASLIADEDTNFGLDPSWTSIYPYQILAQRGEATRIEVRARNYRQRSMRMEVRLELPEGWSVKPAKQQFTVPRSGTVKVPFNIEVPVNWSRSRRRVAIAADVIADGKRLGQIAEAVVDVL